MIVEASVSGFIRTILLILGTLVFLRFIGKLMIAKRNLDEDRRLRVEKEKYDRELARKKATFGKTSILGQRFSSPKTNASHSDVEDADYEDIT